MLLGQDAFSALPFSTSPFLGDVEVFVTHNRLTFTLGVAGISTTHVIIPAGPDSLDLRTAQVGTFTVSGTAIVPDSSISPTRLGLSTADATAIASGSAVITPTLLKNQLTFRSGAVTITSSATPIVTGVPLTFTTTTPGIITWNEIIPGATMVWTPIVPY
tara:strand:+ start:38 stop:517 length:480 start_codon:yes stop_codon:yes gene_type:complete